MSKNDIKGMRYLVSCIQSFSKADNGKDEDACSFEVYSDSFPDCWDKSLRVNPAIQIQRLENMQVKVFSFGITVAT